MLALMSSVCQPSSRDKILFFIVAVEIGIGGTPARFGFWVIILEDRGFGIGFEQGDGWLVLERLAFAVHQLQAELRFFGKAVTGGPVVVDVDFDGRGPGV